MSYKKFAIVLLALAILCALAFAVPAYAMGATHEKTSPVKANAIVCDPATQADASVDPGTACDPTTQEDASADPGTLCDPTIQEGCDQPTDKRLDKGAYCKGLSCPAPPNNSIACTGYVNMSYKPMRFPIIQSLNSVRCTGPVQKIVANAQLLYNGDFVDGVVIKCNGQQISACIASRWLASASHKGNWVSITEIVRVDPLPGDMVQLTKGQDEIDI